MFDKQYRFKGLHALKVDKLNNVFDAQSGAKLFNRNVDIYANAPLIGFLYNRISEEDNTKNPETGAVYGQNVMGDRVIYSQEELLFNFRLIMLLDAKYEYDVKNRINKAFKQNDEKDEERFEGYLRGGIDVLYEKLIEGANNPEDYINKLYDFLDEFDDRFNSSVDTNDIFTLCSNN